MGGEDGFSGRKRKRAAPLQPKLLVADKVEVRSLDEGSLGSWHPAVVTSLKNRARDVRYDGLVCEDGSQKLTEQIIVHPVVDGVIPVGKKRSFYRGLIRPLPPPLEFEVLSLQYGQCIDAYYQEAWWEGVLFDHDKNSKSRSIFFPDMGDVLLIDVEHLRITQDWDEFTQEWKARGNWPFLDLIEQYKQEKLIHISVREIWYEVSEKESFKRIKEWTNFCRVNDWEILVTEVINDHSKLAAESFFEEVIGSMLGGDAECQLRTDSADFTKVIAVPPIVEEEIHMEGPIKRNTEKEGLRLEVNSSQRSNFGINVDNSGNASPIKDEESSKLEITNEVRGDADFIISDNPVEVNNLTEYQIAGHDIEGSPSSLSINHEESSNIHITNEIRVVSDFSISENPVEINNLGECEIAEHESDVVPLVEVCNSERKRKMEEVGRVHMISCSNSETTTREEPPCSAVSVVPFKDEESSKLEITNEVRGDADFIISDNPVEVNNLTEYQIAGHDIEGSPSSLSINHEESSDMHITNEIRVVSDFSISENPVEINNLGECEIAGHESDVVPLVEVCNSERKRKMEEVGRVHMISCSNSETTTREETPCSAASVVPFNVADECNSPKDMDIVSQESPCDGRKKSKWEIAGTDIVPEAQFSPGSVLKYLNRSKGNRDSCSLQLSLRKHLAYLGWKIEVSREERGSRMRYTSPKGKSYLSLVTVCQDWDMAQNKFKSTDQGKETKFRAPYPLPHDVVQPARFPEDVKYCARMNESGDERKETELLNHAIPKDVQDNAKQHLRASGWSISEEEGDNLEVCYISPSGYTCSSLVTACKAYTNDAVSYGIETALILESPQLTDVSDGANEKLIASERLPPDIPMEFVGSGQVTEGDHHNEEADGNSHPLTSCNSLVQRKGKRSAYSEKLITSERLPPDIPMEFVGSGQVAEGGHNNEEADGNPHPLTSFTSLVQRKGKRSAYSEKTKEKKEKALSEVSNGSDDYTARCSKRAGRQLDSSSSFHSPLTVLSWLIDNDVVLPRIKVYYLGKGSRSPRKEGQITREGIKCNCCKTIFGLSKFQAHAEGSIGDYDQPAANIFLEDGRSLLSCQSQLRNQFELKNMTTQSRQPKRRTTNDSVCSICQFGGLLVLCDHCPSSFHRECLDLTEVPEGEWFCPQCCCKICGNNKFNQGSKRNMKGSILNCHQCSHRYHVGCLFKQGDKNLDTYVEGQWFCGIKCKQIFLGLHKLLEKPVLVRDDNLTWTLLKDIPCNNLDGRGTETSVETYSKLNLAVSVMHECFEPMNEPGTRRDIVEDVIFSRGSDLRRLNFQGFYTVILSRDDELIAVAAVRVHGEKVAEIPLVGTRIQYRKLGMCRFLMNELEKKLMELGVERLVMPAAPSVLSTWTTSFGYSKISEPERFKLCSYTFLDFQGAIMCEKILEAMAAQPIRTLQNTHVSVDGTIDGTCNKNSSSFKALQTEKAKDVEKIHQGTPGKAVVSFGNGCDGTLPHVLQQLRQQFFGNRDQLEVYGGDKGEAGLKKSDSGKGSGGFRGYKRQRL